jgi:hypothetical protein
MHDFPWSSNSLEMTICADHHLGKASINMKPIRPLITVFLAILTCALVLTGCSTTNNENASNKRLLEGYSLGQLPPPPDDKPMIKLAATGAVDEIKSRRMKTQTGD